MSPLHMLCHLLLLLLMPCVESVLGIYGLLHLMLLQHTREVLLCRIGIRSLGISRREVYHLRYEWLRCYDLWWWRWCYHLCHRLTLSDRHLV